MSRMTRTHGVPHRLAAASRRLLSAAGDRDADVSAAPPIPLREVFRRFWPCARGGLRWLWLIPLRRLMAGRTTIIISHNLLTVRDATQIVVLDHGRVVEHGTHDDLLARGEAYARLHKLNGPTLWVVS
jgi:ABC-type thiamine transport system ATPase subunit